MVDRKFVDLWEQEEEKMEDGLGPISQLSFCPHMFYYLIRHKFMIGYNLFKVKLNIVLALRPPLFVLTHFFITKHSVYYK
jgi:hypothetical protein